MSRISNEAGKDTGSATDHLKDKAQQVGENIRDMGGQIRDAAREQYGQIRDQAAGYYDQGREKARQWEEGIESYVQDQPIKSLLMAAGVGLLLGILWKRS